MEYLEADDTVKIADSPRNHPPHIQKRVLQKLLNGDFLVVLILHAQLGGEYIASPKQCAKESMKRKYMRLRRSILTTWSMQQVCGSHKAKHLFLPQYDLHLFAHSTKQNQFPPGR
jgi:hypothetical protein